MTQTQTQTQTILNEADFAKAETAKAIAEQNDRFRQTWGADYTIVGKIALTSGIFTLPPSVHVAFIQAVKLFNTFSEDNDPHGEHDFGAFEVTVANVTYPMFWKIDLYDRSYAYGSEAPSDLTQTRRVLTIMLRSEY